MKFDIEWLFKEIKKENNPLLISASVDSFLANNPFKLNIYEEYLINYELLRLHRCGYTKIAYNYRVKITDCIEILSQLLLSKYFNDNKAQCVYRDWLKEVYLLCKDKRKHYIMDEIPKYFDKPIDNTFLNKLINVRKNKNNLKFDDGPFHHESFLLDKYTVEEWLLENKHASVKDYTVRDEIANLLVELSLIE